MFNRDIFKRHVKVIRAVPDQGRGLSLSDIQVMVNGEEESNFLNEDIKCFLIEEFGYNIKFSESERKNVGDVINSLFNINAVKSGAELIKESL